MYLTTRTSLSPIRRGFAPGFVNYKKGCTQIVVAIDKAYLLLAHGRWFSPASSTTKTGRYDIIKILLKVALKHQHSKSKTDYTYLLHFLYELFLLRRTTSVSFSMLGRWKWKKWEYFYRAYDNIIVIFVEPLFVNQQDKSTLSLNRENT